MDDQIDADCLATADALDGIAENLSMLLPCLNRLAGVFRRHAYSPMLLTLVQGDSQSGTVNAALGTSFKVKVTQGDGTTAVQGEQVTFTSSNGGLFSSDTVTTDASGFAEATWTLPIIAGSQSARATHTRTGQVVTITATATADVLAGLEAATTTDIAPVTAGDVVGTPPSVRAVDQFGNPKATQTVTFTVTAGGGSRSPATVDTGSDGIATLTSWTTGASPGANTLTASTGGFTVTFNANGLAVAAAPTQIVVQSGGTQTGVVVGGAASAITFRVKDAGNAAVANVLVTIVTGSGTVSVSSGVTDVNGDIATVPTPGTTVGTTTVSASFVNNSGTTVSVSTTVVTVAAAASALRVVTQPTSNTNSGDVLNQQPIVEVIDQYGNRKVSGTGSSASIVAAIGTGNGTLNGTKTRSASAGLLTHTDLSLVDTDGGTDTIRFTSSGLTLVDTSAVTVSPPVPDHLTIVTSPSTVGTGQGFSFVVEVRDVAGNKIPGDTSAVSVTLTDNGEGATLTGTTPVNCVNGTATFGLSVDLVGSYTLTAARSGLASVVSSSFTVATAGAHPNEPVGMTALADLDLTGATLDTGMVFNTTLNGYKWQASGTATNLKARSTASQASWRHASWTALPSCPNGRDRILECRFNITSGQNNSGNKGYATVDAGNSVKSYYLDQYLMVSSNFINNASGTFKLDYYRQATGTQAGPYVFVLHGSGNSSTGNLFLAHHFQGGNQSVSITNFQQIQRNVWYRIETLIVAQTNAATADGHITHWVDGVKIAQVTGVDWDDTNGGVAWDDPQQLPQNYFGGTGTSTLTATIATFRGDKHYVSYSNSRIAVP